MDRDASTLMQFDVTRAVVTDDVEQRDQSPVSLVIHRVGKEYRVRNHQPGLFYHFPMQRFLDGFAASTHPRTLPSNQDGQFPACHRGDA